MTDSKAAADAEGRRSDRWLMLKVGALILFYCLMAAPCLIGMIRHAAETKQERHRLRHETDHHALLAASRELMRKYPGQYIDHADKDPRVPLIIRELGPSFILIEAEDIRVELQGGHEHYGFNAYAENVDHGDDSGKLIDGLYYYEH